MKMNKRLIYSVLIGLLIVIVLFFVYDFFVIPFDNSNSLSDAIPRKYSVSAISELTQKVNTGGVHYYKFKWKFKPECIRKTGRDYYGYYAVLQQEDGQYAFLFINDERIIDKVLVTDHFKSKSEFDFVTLGQTTIREIHAFDTNYFFPAISNMHIYDYIVQEGIIELQFPLNPVEKDPYWYTDPDYSWGTNVVQTIHWYSNEELKNSDPLPYMPNILQQDKLELSQS